jgi:glycosyl transferase family 25
MNIYCIHERLDKYENRMLNIQRQLCEIEDEYNLSWVDSFPAKDFNHGCYTPFNNLHLSRNKAEKSCFWKHYDALKRISNSDTHGLVLEDDAAFKSSIVRDCKTLLNALDGEDNYYINIEYCSYDVPIWYLNKTLVKMKGTKRAAGYLVSPLAAKKLCGVIEGYLARQEAFNYPADAFVTACWEQVELNIFWSVKPLVWQGSKTGRFESDLSLRKSTKHFLVNEFVLFYVMPLINKVRASFRAKIKDRILGWV